MRSRILLLLLLSVAAWAQTDRGTITGTISDPAGAVVAAAPIEARNVETGALYQAASTATGNYTLAQLPAGTYEMAVSVPGFKRFVRQNVVVPVAQTLRVDVSLEVGAATESVTVSDEVTLLKTESGELSHNIETQRLNNLPVLGIGTFSAGTLGIRNPIAASTLIPGTNFVANAVLRVNGAPANSQAVRIEGQDATNGNVSSSTARTQPSVEAIQEVSIQTSNYAAEFGQAGGGLFNYTMKSGSNQLHGTAYDYLVNEALNAGTPFTDDGNGRLLRPRNRRNDYGFTIGGPVVLPKIYDGHNKTFFFFNWEYFKERQVYNNAPITVPTDGYRSGDFRQALTNRTLATDPLGRPILENSIYDPGTDRLAPNGQRVRDTYPNNTIPAPQMDAVALKVQALIPRAGNSNVIQNLIPVFPGERVTKIPAFKFDHTLTSKIKLSLYWSNTTTAAQYNPVNGAAEGLPAPITAARGAFVESDISRFNYDHALRPTLLLHLGIGYQDVDSTDDAPTTNYNPLTELGLRGGTRNGAGGRFPNFTGLNAARGGMANMGPGAQSRSLQIKPTANASLTWVKNNHTYKFGGEFRADGYPQESYTSNNGQFTFNAQQSTLPSTQGQNLSGGAVGFPYASFLLGRVNNGDITVTASARVGKTQWAMFAQDTWKVTRKLTLDYGLRWDYSTYLRESYGRFPNLSSTVRNPSAGGQPGGIIFEGSGPGRCDCQFAKNYPFALGPRLGLAYQITPKTVLRAGIGVTYTGTSPGNGASGNAVSRNPFSSPSFGDPAMTLANGIPFVPVWPVFDAGIYPIPGTQNGPPVVVDQNAGRPARQVMWSIGLQREVFRNLVVEGSYVGNRGAWWQSNALVNYNALTPERIAQVGLNINNAADRSLLIARVDSALAASRGFNRPIYNGFPAASTVAQAIRPYPQFSTGLTPIWSPLGRTWYDSFQVKASKRYSYGLDFTYAFTFQREFTIGSDSDSAGIAASVNDIFNRQQNKYISGYSRPVVQVLAANYRLPKWGSNRLLSYAVRDWTLGAVMQYSSGQPIRVPLAQNALNGLLFRGTFANRVAGEPLFVKDLNCHCIDPVAEFVLNPKAWADPAAGQFGTSAAYYNDYRYQRRPQESMNVGRLFRITERTNVQVRVEFSNIFNRLQMNDPDSTNALATQTRNPNGTVASGFGRINTAQLLAAGAPQPRSGTFVVRFTF